MTITMFDSTTPDAMPADAAAVAGYTGGHWPTFAGLAARWPNAKRLSIAVTSAADADCLDVEFGDVWPADSPLVAEWVKRQLARGVVRPVVYLSVSAVATLLAGLKLRGVNRADIRLWTAHGGKGEHLCDKTCGFGMTGRADATQWTSTALGRNLDQSLCTDGFFPAVKIADASPAGDANMPVASTNWFTLVPGVEVFALGCPTGGAWLLRRDGSINAVGGAPQCGGGANGQPYWGSRHAAQLEPHGLGYRIVATTGETYDYVPAGA